MGQASASLMKALYRILVDTQGRTAADAWLRGIGMTWDDIEDETRMLPLETRCRALSAFVAASSREALARLPPVLISPECIGAWVRILRGSKSVTEAFSQLDGLEGDFKGTVRWETLVSERGRWRGRMRIAHDPSLEADGLLDIARSAELAAVPALFGWSAAVATVASAPEGGMSGTLGPLREFEVRWPAPRPEWNAGLGAAVGGALGALLMVARLGSTELDLVAMVAMAGVGAGLGLLRVRTRLRRAEIEGQSLRVRALERSLSLKESGDRVAPGQIDGLLAGGQYRVVRRMGAGATGVIYEAVRVVDNLPVALKLLRAVAAHEAVASDRLRREAAALGLSWHPNVVEVFDQGVLPDGTAYMAMELLRGETLAARLRSGPCLTPEELIPIALEVCDALAAIHAAGVVHRDIKPSNIYLVNDRTRTDGRVRAKILDFGIARVEWEETRITQTGGPLGTPGYMSPEQERGSADVDGRSDLFSLGAVLYEALVGEPPPPLLPSGLIRMGEGVPDAARTFEPYAQKAMALVPTAFRRIIEKAMAFDPAERYEDARAFAQALRGVKESLAQASSVMDRTLDR
jgi:serine/threonine-protein kinase